MADILNIGYTGLSVSKKSLETTGHNIANVNTEGFSRQRVRQTTNVPITKSGMVQGTGARLKSINRVHDQFVEKRLNKAISDKEFFQGRTDQLNNVEDVFNEIDGEGLNKTINKFFNSFRDLANQPENETIRSVVRDNAKLVVRDFKRIRSQLDHVAKGIDTALEVEVVDLNQQMDSIARLNRNIATLEAQGEETGDLRDQRDVAVREISKSFYVSAYTDNKNQFVVHARGVGTLVSGTETQHLKSGKLSAEESVNKMPGSVSIYFKNKPALGLNQKFVRGKVGGLIQTRDTDVRQAQEKIDRIAFEMANTTNAVHRRGFVNREIEVDANGVPKAFDKNGPITGINFFKEPDALEAASRNFAISDAVLTDLTNVSTGLSVNSPGDNRVALAISKIQSERVMDDGQATIEESYLKTIGRIGLEAGKAKLNSEQSEGIFAQTTNIKERISGVSLDEETANMVKFQHAYEASAKVMQTAKEMFDVVIGIKR